MLSGGTHSSPLGRDLRVLLLLAVGRCNTLIYSGNLAEKKYWVVWTKLFLFIKFSHPPPSLCVCVHAHTHHYAHMEVRG